MYFTAMLVGYVSPCTSDTRNTRACADTVLKASSEAATIIETREEANFLFIVKFLEKLTIQSIAEGPLAVAARGCDMVCCVSRLDARHRLRSRALCHAGLCNVPGADAQHSCQTTRLFYF